MNDQTMFPMPVNENHRIRISDEMDLMRRRDDPFFRDVTHMARKIFGTPVAFISLISGETQTFLTIEGFDATCTPRTHSMCAYTVATRKPVISADTHADPRFVNHPIVVNPPNIRFSASAPVILASGFCLGTVCAVDTVPHDEPTRDQVKQLEMLANMVARFYEVPMEPDPEHVNRLRQISEQAQEEFLALIGHELRTPLNGIYGMAQVLEPADDDESEIVDAIVLSAERLNGIVESILSFTELRSGDTQLDEGPVELDKMIDGTINSYRKLAQLQSKTLQRDGASLGLTIRADKSKLDLAISCLLANFVAHGGAQARVSTMIVENGSLEIKVWDDGPGVPEAHLAKIWNAFSVGSDVHTRMADGVGLGLPLTRRIVELHGGEFDLIQDTTGLSAKIRLPSWRVT